jgi:hypothetical protein
MSWEAPEIQNGMPMPRRIREIRNIATGSDQPLIPSRVRGGRRTVHRSSLKHNADREDDRSDSDTMLSSDAIVDIRNNRQRYDGSDAKGGIDDAEKGALGVVEVCIPG